MQRQRTAIEKDLVLVGGGHSHITVLKQFGMHPMSGVRLTVICRDVHTPYSGMLPGFLAGHYGYDDVQIDLGPLSRFAGARLYYADVIGLDLANKTVRCRQHPDVPYDVLSLNIGSTPDFAQVPGAEQVVVPVKPISTFKARYYIEQKLTTMGIGKGDFCPETIAEYTRCCTPEQLHAVCEDYRAGATIDFEMDRADVEVGNTIQCPVLVIWGTLSHTEKMSDPRAAWPQYVRSQPQFCPLPCGHYPAEQVPEEVYTVLDAFFKA